MKKLFHHIRAARSQGGRLWDDREAIADETRRAFKEGPEKFRSADRGNKAAVLVIVAMIAVIIYMTL